MAVKNRAASALARLKNKAEEKGINYQFCLLLFFLEEFLRRLSHSRYRDNLVLKGGMFIYKLTELGSRPTRDMDFLMCGLSNDPADMQTVMEEICAEETGNEFIRIEVKGTEPISLDRKYPGVRTKFIGHITNVTVPFYVDVGADDIIVPGPVIRKITPLLPDFESPEISTYSLESTIAEKFDAILQRMETTSRMKDFFDIYYLSDTFDFDGQTLQLAVKTALENRTRVLKADTFAKIAAFAKNPSLQTMWSRFVPARERDLPLETVLERMGDFLGPVYASLLDGTVFERTWSCEDQNWTKGGSH